LINSHRADGVTEPQATRTAIEEAAAKEARAIETRRPGWTSSLKSAIADLKTQNLHRNEADSKATPQAHPKTHHKGPEWTKTVKALTPS